MDIDFGRAANDYCQHRAGFPDALLEWIHASVHLPPGSRILDLGTGTGKLVRGLAGLERPMLGLDPSLNMLQTARLEGDADSCRVDYLCGRAEEIPLGAGSLGLVTAGQCWHWFDAGRVLAEIHRVLEPNGHLLICSYDWVPEADNVVARTESLILQHNPRWALAGGDGRHPEYLNGPALAGFKEFKGFELDVPQVYSHEAWRGRIRASAGIGATLDPEAVAAFDRELGALLAADFPADPMPVPHRAFAVSCRRA